MILVSVQLVRTKWTKSGYFGRQVWQNRTGLLEELENDSKWTKSGYFGRQVWQNRTGVWKNWTMILVSVQPVRTI